MHGFEEGLRLARVGLSENPTGYDGVYAPKRHSPCLEFGYHSDGVAILWKKSAFAPIGSERRFFIEDDGSESARPYLLALLRHRECDSTLLVATTHMKAKLSQPNEDLRAKQIELQAQLEQARSKASESEKREQEHGGEEGAEEDMVLVRLRSAAMTWLRCCSHCAAFSAVSDCRL